MREDVGRGMECHLLTPFCVRPMTTVRRTFGEEEMGQFRKLNNSPKGKSHQEKNKKKIFILNERFPDKIGRSRFYSRLEEDVH